ncbi:hypothetical protein EVG20_g5174 [Dentipellis fragilis]|uniref:glutathione synthase n=1 Tax=Dentipellis fragilis TaxID=205917 RepID=A0A4Y9YWE2_9AGAM|nr:hypothetical protein EVG20_g5174 [Dentipellis fragilis]
MSAPRLPKNYKAIVCNGIHQGWTHTIIPTRDPGPNEVFLKVLASGICNSDHFILDGMWPGIQYPRIAGHEVVGRVISLGSAVDPHGRFQVGQVVGVGWSGGYCGVCVRRREGDFAACVKQPVTGFTQDGGHAEFMYAPQEGKCSYFQFCISSMLTKGVLATAVVSLPEDATKNASYAELAPLLCAGVTVFDALRTSPHKPGDICLIQGIGGLGHLAVQYASKMGFKVYAASGGSDKEILAKSLGAAEYIDYRTTNIVEYMQALGGAKAIICTAPSVRQISAVIPAASRYGVVTLVSAATDGNVEVFNPFLNMSRVTLRGWACGAAVDAEACVRFSTLTNVKAMVKEYKLEDFIEAYEDMAAGKPKFRNVITFSDSASIEIVINWQLQSNLVTLHRKCNHTTQLLRNLGKLYRSSLSNTNIFPAMSFVSWPPSLTPTQLEHLTLLATTYALSHSLLYLPPHEPNSPPPPAPTSAIHAPLSLFPTPIPSTLFNRAKHLQRAYNTLYARVALDTAFLDEVMGTGPTGAGAVDEFTGALWRAWKAAREEGPLQTLHLGLFRSDYLLHQPEGTKEIGLKQVEFNTISSSFGALSEQVSKLHRHLQASTRYFDSSSLLQPGNFPPNDTISGLVSGLAEAHKAYGNPSSSILFVVQPDERNVFDQRLLEYELLDKHNIHVHRRTFPQLAEHAQLSPTRSLLISPLPAIPSSTSTHEISVVYYRAGYTPKDYPTPQVYDTRLLLERSRAIQCPSLALQLAGGKKVQEVLARPGVLERFLQPGEGTDEVRASWVGMWGLDASADEVPVASVSAEDVGKGDEPAGTRLARARAQDLVLKPQREGGGNNIYKQAIPPFLDTLPARERAAWIAMELIKPPRRVSGYLVRAGGGEAGVMRAEVVSELGIFGWALFGGEGKDGVVKEEEVGWLVRSKR